MPRFPGITSGLGCVLAPVRHDFVQSIGQPLADAAIAEIDNRFADQAAAGRRLLNEDGVPLAEIVVATKSTSCSVARVTYSGCR